MLGVELAHERERVEVVGPDTANEPGAVGAVATITLVVVVLVPFAFVAVRVYMVVEVGFTVVDPTRVEVEKVPGVMAREVAFATFQESVLVPADATMEEEAVKEEMEGGDPLLTVTVTDAVEVLFEVSVERAQSVVDPLAVEVVFHGIE